MIDAFLLSRRAMAVVDPYSTCSCGSGQKYKWCCQKVEAYTERAQRLLDSGQHEAALKPLEEGLAKVPDNVSLLLRKAVVHLHLNQGQAALGPLRAILQKHPAHLGASILLTRVALETEGPRAAAAQFQQAMSARPADERKELVPLASFLGSALNQAGDVAAGIKHLELALAMGGGDDKQDRSTLQTVKANPLASLWEKNPDRLAPAPREVSEQFRVEFERALHWASEGLWSAAASAFELLATGTSAGAVAARNRGLCCLWLADYRGAVTALRQFIRRSGPTTQAVDFEALCQSVDEDNAPRDLVEFVHLTWPIRNRAGLLEALRAEKTCEQGEDRPLDLNDPNGPELARFYLLDRPRIAARPGLTREEIPLIDGQVLVSPDTVILETYDDGRLDGLVDRFTAVAGLNIPPAHPRTKIMAKEPRYVLALSQRGHIPANLSGEEEDRLIHESAAYTIAQVWPKTPHPALRWRSPLEAAKAGDAETALRAAVRQLEASNELVADRIDWAQFRAKLGLEPEPAIEPDRLDIDLLHLSRLSLVPAEQLDDDQIVALYRRAREYGVRSVVNRASRLIDERSGLVARSGIDPLAFYGELALEAAQRNDRTETAAWLARGQDSTAVQNRAAHTPAWEMVELQTKMVLEEPDVWVPYLAALLDRYRGNQDATAALLLRLVNLGLVRVVADPTRPDQIVLDTRILEDYMNRYGPRVTTASGQPGHAASRGELWTPESAGARAPIWTPGSASSAKPGPEKSKIILPGRS
jgi:tetratricopeptide (TPR) repeat protein